MSGGRTREDAGHRLRRLLAIVPWLVEQGGATVTEIAERFGLSEDKVVRDLELASCCGLPPFTPDQLIDVWVDEDGTVYAHPGPFFERPLRLSAAEGFTLLAAGRTLLAIPGVDEHGALGRALEKLAAALGGADVDVELEEPEHLAALRRAIEDRERVEVEYYTASRDEVTRRRIDPHTLYASEGHWHVVAQCHLAGGERDFRVDRVRSLSPTGEHFEPPARRPGPAPRFERADADIVTITLPAWARWVVESYPTRSVQELKDGRLRVDLAVSGRAWLERLLLRVGSEAQVQAPRALADVGREAAARVLARYP